MQVDWAAIARQLDAPHPRPLTVDDFRHVNFTVRTELHRFGFRHLSNWIGVLVAL